MDAVRSWLDPDEVRRLAQRLLVGRGEVLLPTAETPFGAAFEGFAGGVGVVAARPAAVVAEPPAPVVPQPAPAPRVEPAAPAEPAPGPPPLPQGAAREAEPAGAPPAPEAPAALAAPAAPAAPAAGVVIALEQLDEVPEPVVEERPAEPPRGPFLQRVQRFRDWLRTQFGVRGMFLLDREGAVIFDDGVHEKLQALARSLAQASRAANGAGSNVHVKLGAEATLEVIPANTHYGLLVLGAVAPQAIPPKGVAMIIDSIQRTAMPPGEGR